MTSQQLYYLHEMTKLTQNIGQEEEGYPSYEKSKIYSDPFHLINLGQSDKRIALEHKVWERMQRISQRFFQQDAGAACVYAAHEGFLWFVTVWDHWQPSLKDMVFHLSRSRGRVGPTPEETRRYLWDDDFDKDS